LPEPVDGELALHGLGVAVAAGTGLQATTSTVLDVGIAG
jgi:hypothetical protein